MTRAFHWTAGLCGLFALVLQYGLIVSSGGEGGILGATVSYFSYFTILSNIVATAVFLALARKAAKGVGKALASQAARAASALYLSNVAVVYHSVLASQWDPQGLQLVSDIILHTVMPIAAVADWLLLAPKRDLRFAMIPRWVLLPFFFGAYTLARGAMTGLYPYPFLRVTELGYPTVLMNMTGLLAAFAGAGAIMIVLGRMMPANRRREKQPA
jgi:hypothetical protein